ncbi:MAG: glycosyltransferase [Dolichospermum sp. JUN01]|nr:glycosyltransferase [Dolichospermum sp. JUN01]
MRLKILHYIVVYAPAWQFGGVVTWATQLCEELVNLGHEVEVFTSTAGLENYPEIPINQPVIRNGVKVTYFKQENGMGIKCPDMEKAVIARVKEFDIVHISGVWQRTSPIACKAAKESGIPVVQSLHGALSPYSWRQKTAKKFAYYLWQERFNVTNAAGIHYTSKQELEECQWLKLPGQPFIVPNGINTKFWQPAVEEAKEWRKSHKIDEDEFVLLNVGRLHHKKGLDLLPQILVSLRHLNWRMVFVGGDDDGTQEKLKQAFQSANLLDRVLFLERCEPQQLLAVYTAANLFVLPSRHENFGNVVIEALACECPVLISDKVGLHDEVVDSGMGWVLPRVAKDWADCITQLVGMPEKLQVVKYSSRAWVESIFSVEKSSQEMVNYYLDCMKK